MSRTMKNPRVMLRHPGPGKESQIILWALTEGTKRENIIEAEITEGECLELVEEAIRAANVVRINREREAKR